MTHLGQKIIAALSSMLLLFGVTACSNSVEKPDIVVTTNILGDVVTHLVGDTATVKVLMKPNADPHSFGLSAQEAGAMEQADLIIANGLGLEEGLASHLDNARSQGVKVLEVGDKIDPLPYSAEAHGDDSEGNSESSLMLDPHFWTDPAKMIKATEIIQEELVTNIAPDNADAINKSAQKYRDELTAMDKQVAEMLGSVDPDDRKLVTNHHVFGYLAHRFDYRIIGAIIPGGSTLASPSAADLRDLANIIREQNVPAIFADSSQPQRLSEVLASETGVNVEVVPLFTESLTEPDGLAGNYIDMQKINAERISTALKKN